MNAIFTIGYESADLSDFLATLRKAKVDLLLDVREIPISRRHGYSKSALRLALEDSGIAYEHEKRLGSPKPIRDELKQTKNLKQFFSRFEKYLDTQEQVLDETAENLEGRIALMCYERDVNTCHRRSVADRLALRTGVKPFHLGVKKGAGKREKSTAGLRAGQSVSTT